MKLSLRSRLSQLGPRVSATERDALAAGTVSFEGELFRGRLDVDASLALPWPELDPREHSFLAGPVAELCALVDPGELEQTGELPAAAWRLLREERFFGLAIPETWGGRGFSPLAQSEVFASLAAHALGLSAIVLIPNSVGPAELLLDHGTDAQRAHWLPRLARGEELPCFALTEPNAGSDAAALESTGTLELGPDGQLAIRLDFDKRYITLGPIATVIGLAFRLLDPHRLLDDTPPTAASGDARGDRGITLALVPASTPGVEQGPRHDPLGVALPNGPLRGRGVLVPLEAVVGERAGIGRGWGMVMEALSAGRSLSLPAQSVGGARHLARVVGAYGTVRRQFGQPIARFEGIVEKVARIAGTTWALDAARRVACGVIAEGARPSVLSAVLKVESTERTRRLAADAMDVLGGAAICLGPRNLVARAWQAAPIGITVEGANVLTRTLIVFGQGAIRCHPAALAELAALESGRLGSLLAALARHLWFSGTAWARLLVAELTRGLLTSRSWRAGPAARWWRRLGWSCARFAVAADLAMLLVGPRLKRRGRLGGAFADWLGAHVLVLASLRRYQAGGRREDELPLVAWAAESLLGEAQAAAEAAVGELLPRPLGVVATAWLRLWRVGEQPRGSVIAAAARTLTRLDATREALVSSGVGAPPEDSPLGELERAFAAALEAEPAIAALREAARSQTTTAASEASRLDELERSGVLNADQVARIRRAQALATLVLSADAAPAAATTVEVR